MPDCINGLNSSGIVHVSNGRYARARDRYSHAQIWTPHVLLLFVAEFYSPVCMHRCNKEHIRAIFVTFHFKDRISKFPKNAGSKWSKRLTKLDFQVHLLLHLS